MHGAAAREAIDHRRILVLLSAPEPGGAPAGGWEAIGARGSAAWRPFEPDPGNAGV